MDTHTQLIVTHTGTPSDQLQSLMAENGNRFLRAITDFGRSQGWSRQEISQAKRDAARTRNVYTAALVQKIHESGKTLDQHKVSKNGAEVLRFRPLPGAPVDRVDWKTKYQEAMAKLADYQQIGVTSVA